MNLQLEVNPEMVDKTVRFDIGEGHTIMMTPPIGEEYWMFRVKLSPDQSIIGFPKFCTIGIGFAKEEDWNTNLPYSSSADAIYKHIRHNKADDSISDEDCLAAISMIQVAAAQYQARNLQEQP